MHHFHNSFFEGASVITQIELERLEALQADLAALDELVRRRDELRRNLAARIESGDAIEPGRLSIRLRRTVSTRFSHAKLVAVLGAAATEELGRAIQPTIVTWVQLERQEAAAELQPRRFEIGRNGRRRLVSPVSR